MKKLVLTAAILMGFAMSTHAQNSFSQNSFSQNSYSENNPTTGGDLFQQNNPTTTGGGLFQRGAVPEDYMRGDDAGLWLPGHNIFGNWNSLYSGTDGPLPVPLGGGALLLVGFGAAYAMSKRKKKD